MSAVSVFNWRGTPTTLSFGPTPHKRPGAAPPLLNGSLRNGTASINTEQAGKAVRAALEGSKL